MPNDNWGTIHSSVFADAGRLLRWTQASLRPHGAVRYRCPVAGSLVLVTDTTTLKKLARPLARVRCSGCGEMHMLTREAGGFATAELHHHRGHDPVIGCWKERSPLTSWRRCWCSDK